MNVALRPASLDVISLCTGGGGLDLGVELAIPGACARVLVEREGFAVAHLVEAMRQGLMAPAPVWSDVTTFDGRRWRGLVDGVIGGIPCQPHSLAGKRLGADDERDLWSAARRIIVQSGAWFVLIENVEGMLSSGGAERVWRDLRRLGFRVEIGLFSAAETGAPHQRNRTFILAVHDGRLADADQIGLRRRARSCHGGPGQRCCDAQNGCCDVADAERLREQRRRAAGDIPCPTRAGEGQGTERQRHGDSARDGRADVADGVRRGQQRRAQPDVGPIEPGQQAPRRRDAQRCGADVADAARWEQWGSGERQPRGGPVELSARRHSGGLPLYPPGPSDLDGWRRVFAHSPDLEPAVRRMADGVAAGLDLDRACAGRAGANDNGPHAARVERLRMLGNGVVPLQAAYALRTLSTRLAAAGSAGAARLVRLMAA